MEIHAVIEHYQGMDNEAWSYWIEKRIISYHSTKELAYNKIENLLNGKENSILLSTELDGKDKDEYPLFSCQVIELEN